MKAAKITFTIALIFSTAFLGLAQKGVEDGSKFGHGEDSVRCVRNYSLYREYYKQKNYNDALPYWRVVFAECPRATKSIYLNGAAMYKFHIIQAEKSSQKTKDLYIDTLMQIYNQRVKWYPKDKAKVLGYKATDLLRFKKDDLDGIKKSYKFSKDAFNQYGDKAPKSVIVTFMTTTLLLFEKNVIPENEVVENYAKTMEVMDKQVKENPDDEDLTNVQEAIQANFANSGAASCESLIQLFTPQLKENPEDIEVLKKISYWLNQTGCTDSDLYMETTIALNKIEPTPTLAYHIAKLYNTRGQYKDAVKFYEQAIAGEEDASTKAKFLVELGYIIQSEYGDLKLAKKYALEAMKADPKSGQPNVLLGNIYAAVKDFGEDELAHKAVFWVAVDQYKKAMRKDPELANVVNKKIQAYSKYFPDTETIFFYGYKAGGTYHLGDWINTDTKIRTRK
jgi:tetratricopeptide (TPR) repeat protein